LAAAILRRWLAHPLTASLDLDDPATTELRRQIIASKPFLRAIYDEWYALIAAALPTGQGPVLELGSGAGYCDRFVPGLITSEVIPCHGVNLVFNAAHLPFPANTLRGIIMTNVLHHLPDVHAFFCEAERCLRGGGKIVMIEPWMTGWSRFVYSRLHHEPLHRNATDWRFAATGPLSGANIALPWMVFERDRGRFGAEFPQFCVEQIRPLMPFRYILSGGVALRSLLPGFLYHVCAGMERALRSQMHRLGMFALIVVRKTDKNAGVC
jgi:SAM-dependent methyltransferase